MSKSLKTSATKLLASTIFTSSLIYAAPVIAQDDDDAKSRYAIDEIVTTARRIEESLQDAPLAVTALSGVCLLYTSPSPRDRQKSRMPSSA